MAVTPVMTPGLPSNAIASSGSNDASGENQAAHTSGDAARLAGQDRETRVANIVSGSPSGEKVAVPGLGSTDIDVVASNGDLVAVGGPAKANNLGKLGQELRIYQTIADQRGVSAQAYLPRELLSQQLILRLKYSVKETSRYSLGVNDGQAAMSSVDS